MGGFSDSDCVFFLLVFPFPLGGCLAFVSMRRAPYFEPHSNRYEARASAMPHFGAASPDVQIYSYSVRMRMRMLHTDTDVEVGERVWI